MAKFSCHSIAFHYFVILNMIFDCPIFLSAKSKCDVQMDVVVLFQLFRKPISNYCIPDNVNAFENIFTNYLTPFIASPLKKLHSYVFEDVLLVKFCRMFLTYVLNTSLVELHYQSFKLVINYVESLKGTNIEIHISYLLLEIASLNILFGLLYL